MRLLIWQVLLLCSLIERVLLSEDEEMLPRIGIIGAGISGTSSAYYLRQLFGEKAKIDVFEAERVGGRTALINLNGQDYEAGGSVIHNRNRYMVNFAKNLNKDHLSRSARVIGLYGNDGMLFQTSKWTAVTLARLVWRYGMDLYNIQEWTKNMIMTKFDRIYDFQDKGMSFTTVEDMLRAMSEDFVNMTRFSMKDCLKDAGISERFIDEFGMAAVRNNYGQTTDVHGFVGAVSMVGVEPGLWSVQNGNREISVGLLKESQSSFLHAKVNTVALIKDEFGSGSVTYEVEYEKLGSEEKEKTGSREYDIVIVATPLEGTRNKISFVEFPNEIPSFSQEYHKTVAMFVEGKINTTTFNMENQNEFPPDLFAISQDVFFNSIGQQSPVSSDKEPEHAVEPDHAVWKTFLNKVPTEEQIGKLFESRKDLRLVEWLAYPKYKPNMALPPFVLYDRLYYVNAVESAAAAMEMNVVGARNVALLAYNHWQGNFDKIDEIHLPSSKTEDGKERSDL